MLHLHLKVYLDGSDLPPVELDVKKTDKMMDLAEASLKAYGIDPSTVKIE